MAPPHDSPHDGPKTNERARLGSLCTLVSCPSWARTRTLLIQSRGARPGSADRSTTPDRRFATFRGQSHTKAHTKIHPVAKAIVVALTYEFAVWT